MQIPMAPRRRPRIPSIEINGETDANRRISGAVAQLGERLLCKQEVVGSIPSGSTNAVGLALCGKKLAVGWAGTIRACSSVG